jgi:ferredoxin
MTAPVRLAVDLIACDGRRLCAELLPELITLDDWGYPMLSPREVPAALEGEASAAVKLCPRLALRLEAGRALGR